MFREFGPYQQERQVLRTFSMRSHVGRRRLLPPAGIRGTHLVATRGGEFVTGGKARDVVAFRLKKNGRLVHRVISAGTRNPDNLGDIGVDRSGNAYFSYVSEPSVGVEAVVRVRRWSRSGALGPVRRISPVSHYADIGDSATDLEGDTMVVWIKVSESGESAPRVYSRIWRRDGSLGRPRAFGELPVPEGNVAFVPAVVIDDDGDGLVTWPSEPDDDRYVGWTRQVWPDGRLGRKVRPRSMILPHGIGITPRGRVRLAMTTRSVPDRVVLVTGP